MKLNTADHASIEVIMQVISQLHFKNYDIIINCNITAKYKQCPPVTCD